MSNDTTSYIMASLLEAAEEEYPDFADSIRQGGGAIEVKYRELCQARDKNQKEDSTRDEAIDLLCVAWLFYRGYWRTGDEEGYDHTAYDGENIRTVKD